MRKARFFYSIASLALFFSSFVFSSTPVRAQSTPPTYSVTQTIAPPRLHDFFGGNYYRDAVVSPDGVSMAVVKRVGEQYSVEILNLSNPQLARGNALDLPFSVRSLTWKDASNLILEGSDQKGHPKVWLWKTSESRVRSLYLLSPGEDDYQARPTYSTDAQRRAVFMAEQELQGDSEVFAGITLESSLLNDPEHVLINVRQDRKNRLFRVKLTDLSLTVLDEGDPSTWSNWIVARGSGLPEIRRQWTWDSATRSLIQPRTAATPQRLVRQIIFENHFDFDIIGPSDKPGFVTVRGRQNGDDLASIHTYNIASGRFGERLIAPQAGYDVLQADFNDDGALFGVTEERGVLRPRARLATDQARINKIAARLAPTDSFSVLSRGGPGGLWTVSVFSPTDYGTLWVDDAKNDRFLRIGDRHRALVATSVGTSRWINYTARDGRGLTALVLRPASSPIDAILPTVIMPHGGPHGVLTTSEFDHLAAFLTSRGYQVAQPNFRGSAGRGAAFTNAGKRQWGGAMQNDVSDLVSTLIAGGATDASKVAIVGGSYGGYAALAGATLTPDLYRCAVSINGVSDLSLQMAFVDASFTPDVQAFWRSTRGDPISDAAEYAARSPVRFASAVAGPVLLLVGQQDKIVDPLNSKVMHDALARAGKRSRLVSLPRMGHSAHRGEDNMLIFGEIDHFLDACIGPRQYTSKPPADRARPTEHISVSIAPN